MVRELVGYRLTPDGYEELRPNAKGWLWLEPVNLWLSLEGEDLVCYDAAAEERIRQLEAELQRRTS